MSKWREKYKVHPAADIFPMMSDEELDKLGDNIKANGLSIRIVFGEHDVVLDGRNRLEAMERAGVPLQSWDIRNYCGDPVAFIISANIHRRHLTKEQQTDLIVAAVRAADDEVNRSCKQLFETLTSEALGKPRQLDVVSVGGRGKVNKVKAAAVAIAKEHGISKSTVERSLAKANPSPQPKRYAAKPLPKPRSGKPVVGREAARRHYLDLCAGIPAVDLDAEQEIVIDAFDALREIAGERAMRRTN